MLTSEMISKYDQFVYDNNFGELYEEIAKDYGQYYYSGIFKAINYIHNAEGHIHSDLNELRSRIKLGFQAYLIYHHGEDYTNGLSKYI